MTLGLVLVTLSPMRPRDTLLAALIAGLFSVSLTAAAQTDPVDHGAHHPGGGAPSVSSPAPAPAPTDPRGGIGMSGIMGAPPPPMLPPATSAQSSGGCGAMGCMGGSGTKPFYATLMDMPSLTPEARRFIEDEAGKRLGSGSEAITTGQALLHHALSANDPAAMQRAIADVRLGVLQAESGAAALLAVNEGQPPRQIALTWFKGQTSVPATVGMSMNEGPWGLSWYHLTTMVFLVAFMLGAILIHYARLRRIDGLVQRLTPGATPAPAPAGSPTPAPAPAARAASGTAPKPARPSVPAIPAAPTQNPPSTEAPAPATASKRWSGALRVADNLPRDPDRQDVPAHRTRGRSHPVQLSARPVPDLLCRDRRQAHPAILHDRLFADATRLRRVHREARRPRRRVPLPARQCRRRGSPRRVRARSASSLTWARRPTASS